MDSVQHSHVCTHSQNIHTPLYTTLDVSTDIIRVSLPPSLWRSCLSWPASFLMANLRYTTWTRPFTSTSCWPFSRGSMKNSPLSVRIRPDWGKKNRIVSFECLPTSSKGMTIPLEPVNTVCTIVWKEQSDRGLTQVGL